MYRCIASNVQCIYATTKSERVSISLKYASEKQAVSKKLQTEKLKSNCFHFIFFFALGIRTSPHA